MFWKKNSISFQIIITRNTETESEFTLILSLSYIWIIFHLLNLIILF